MGNGQIHKFYTFLMDSVNHPTVLVQTYGPSFITFVQS